MLLLSYRSTARFRREGEGGDPAIRVDDDGVWHDSITGCPIDSGRDSFHFTAKRSGVVVLTASLIPGEYSSG